MKKLFLICLLCITYSMSALAKTQPLTLDWIDLIPESERKTLLTDPMAFLQHNGNAPAAQNVIGKVREDLNNKEVRIPGFIIPLEGDYEKVTAFLLVPYMGACIHVPPPPPNQIVYVEFPSGASATELWDVVNVVGTLKTETIDSELGQAGYLLEGIKVEAYEDEEEPENAGNDNEGYGNIDEYETE